MSFLDFVYDAAHEIIDLFFNDSPSADVIPTEQELSDMSFYSSLAEHTINSEKITPSGKEVR